MHVLGNHKVEILRAFDEKGRHITITQVFTLKDKRVARGRAICSEKDNFNKALGLKAALSKALTKSKIKKEDRRKIWEGFRTMTQTPRWNV